MYMLRWGELFEAVLASLTESPASRPNRLVWLTGLFLVFFFLTPTRHRTPEVRTAINHKIAAAQAVTVPWKVTVDLNDERLWSDDIITTC